MPDRLGPKDAAEAIAIFRAQVIGPLVCREHSRGELAAALRALAQTPVRTPAGTLRTFSFATLERWYYAYKAGGLAALAPTSRRAGFATQLTAEQRELLLAIRREHRAVITVARSLATPEAAPWVEHEDRRIPLRRVDPKLNARRRRARPDRARGIDAVPFDPPGALLDRALGRQPKHKETPS